MTPELPAIHEIWVYLSGSPLLALILTLGAYQCGVLVYERADRHPMANPVAIAVIIVATTITGINMPYAKYFEGAQFVHFLLGSATVALAVPLYANLDSLRKNLLPIAGALVTGSVVAVVSAVGIGWMLGASRQTLLSMAPKSVTTPIAMGIAEKIGGLPSLTAVLVVITGIVGAVLARGTLNLLRIEDHAVRGFAVGVAAHGIGPARAFQVSERM